MKLKKIASLMLAGVMAVSMLAACGDASSNGGSNPPVEEPTTTNLAAAFNKDQDTVTFDGNSALDEQLAKVVKELAETTTPADVTNQLAKYNSVAVMDNTNKFFDLTTAPSYDGETKTLMGAIIKTSDDAWNNVNAIKLAAMDMVDDVIDNLESQSKEEKNLVANEEYYKYSYTGNVSMVSENNGNKTTNYYFVWTITQTCTKAKFGA